VNRNIQASGSKGPEQLAVKVAEARWRRDAGASSVNIGAGPAVTPESPWLGLKSFEESAAEYFFGRDAEVRELSERVEHKTLTVFFGKSGLGKTSLLRAGLVPMLRGGGYLPVIIRLNFSDADLQLVEQVLSKLRETLLSSGYEKLANFPERGIDLWQLFHDSQYGFVSFENVSGVRPVLIFDQFEEIFSKGEHRRSDVLAFSSALSCLVENYQPEEIRARLEADDALSDRLIFKARPCKVLLSLREDFLHHLERWRRFIPSLMDNRFELLSLTGPKALSAIYEPGTKREAKDPIVDFETAKNIVRFVAGVREEVALSEIEAVPPLLSLICDEMNKKRLASGEERLQSHQPLGKGEDILEKFFAARFKGKPVGLREEIEDSLLSRGGGERERLTLVSLRARLIAKEIPAEEVDLAIDDLVDNRLLTIEERSGVRSVELTHDVLIPVIAASRAKRHEREAKERAERAKEDAERKKEEAEERTRVIEEKRRLEEKNRILAETLAKEQERTALRLRRLAWMLSLVALAAAAAAIFGFWQKAEAERQKGTAEKETKKALYAEKTAKEQKGLAEQQQAEAEKQQAEAEKQARLATQAQQRTSEVASQAELDVAHYSQRAGHDAETLLHLAQALHLNQKNYRAIEFASEMLAQSGWPFLEASLIGHNAFIDSVQFSPDGKRVLTASDDNTARLWDALSCQPIGKPMQHQGSVRSAKFSPPDGKRVVTASYDSTAQLWDAATGKAIGNPMRHEDRVNSAEFSPDGKRVVTASDDYTARLWNALTGVPIGEPMQHGGPVYVAKFSPDGKRVVTASYDNTAQLWDASTGQKIGEPMRHKDLVSFAEFSPDGKRVVTASHDSTARLWDGFTGKPIGQMMQQERGVNSAHFSPDGQCVVTASGDGAWWRWDALTGKPIGQTMGHGDPVFLAQFSPDGQRVVTAAEDGSVRLWDTQTAKPIGHPMQHGDLVICAQFSPDGKRLATASLDGIGRLWDAASGKEIDEPLRLNRPVNSAQFSPDGKRVVTASMDMTAQLWDATTGKAIGNPMRHTDRVNSAQFSPDGKRVVTTSNDKTAHVWDALTGAPIGEPMQHGKLVAFAQFSSDGKRVVTASYDNTAQLWDALTGRKIGEPMRHKDVVYFAEFSPDGKRVVTASHDSTARLWDALTGLPIGESMQHGGEVLSAQFSPGGERVVTASDDNTVRLWNALTGDKIGEPMLHRATVYSAEFSSDGRRVVSASSDRTARLWDALSGKPIGEPMQHGGEVLSARFSPDGQRVVTASADGTRLWDALSGKAIGEPMQHGGEVLSAQFSPDGKRVVITSTDNMVRIWDVPAVSAEDSLEDVRLLAELAEATGGFTVPASGQADIRNALTPKQVRETREKIAAKFAGPSSSLTPLEQCMKWSVLEPRSRTIFPFSEITLAQWEENRITEGTYDSLRAAIQLDPANAYLTALFGRSLADHALARGIDPDEARRVRGEADFETRRALELAPDNDEVRKLRTEVVKMLQGKQVER
jgi:WD40 repeat protein